MKQLKDYIFEAMQELYHFTNAYNLVDILKDDTWVSSNDYDKELYISTTRMRNGDFGYPTGMLDDENVVRVVFDAQKLNTKFKIIPVDKMNGKRLAVKANWSNPDDYDKYFNVHQTNVEAEDRVIVKDEKIKNISKYIKSIHVNLENIDDKYLYSIESYCKKLNIKLKKYEDYKSFNLAR
jgi:hypothetical protein